MSTVRDELHDLIDQLPEDEVTPALSLLRSRMSHSPRERAVATIARVQGRMQGVTDVDEAVEQMREHPRA